MPAFSDPQTARKLSQVKAGEQVRVAALLGCRHSQCRLADMGLRVGATVRVLKQGGGPLLVAVGESRLALGRGMAAQVLVEEG